MTKIIAVANQKGGTGKTATSVNLGIGLAMQGKNVLVIDADPQGNCTSSFGINAEQEYTLADIMIDTVNEEQDTSKGIIHTDKGVDLIPADLSLASIELQIVSVMGRETLLRRYISGIKDNYDYIIIDCMPFLRLVTINVLSCTDTVLIPVQASYLPVKGLQELIKTIYNVKKHLNKALDIEGILITMYNKRTTYGKETVELLRESYGDRIRIFDCMIPRSVKLEESTTACESIYKYSKNSPVTAAYKELVNEIGGTA